MLGERVGFVPANHTHINYLGRFSTARTSRTTQNLSIRYKTGTAKSCSDLVVMGRPDTGAPVSAWQGLRQPLTLLTTLDRPNIRRFFRPDGIFAAHSYSVDSPSGSRRKCVVPNHCGRQARSSAILHPVKLIGVLDTHFGQLLELPGAVTDLLSWHTEEIKERELQVCQRRVLRIDEMTAAFERAAAAADEQRRERTVRMAVAVADGGAI